MQQTQHYLTGIDHESQQKETLNDTDTTEDTTSNSGARREYQ